MCIPPGICSEWVDFSTLTWFQFLPYGSPQACLISPSHYIYIYIYMYVYKLVTNRPKHVCLTHHCLACYCHCFVLPTGGQEAGSCWSGVCHHRRMWRTGQDRGSPATRECGSLQTGSGYHWEVLQWGMWESTLLEHVHIHCILVQVVVTELRLNWLIFSWTDHNNEIICFLFTYTQDEEDQSLAPNTSNGAFQFSPAVQTVPAGGFNFWLLPTTTVHRHSN